MALLATTVRRALRSVKDPSPQDVAAAELAITYAKAIDAAGVIAVSMPEMLKMLDEVAGIDNEIHDRLTRLLPAAAQVEQAAVLASLGPKLLATMDALLITPKARAAVQRGVKDAAKRSNPLDALRARRAARVDNSAPVDPSAP